jgi:hypothetical protein
MRNSIFCRSLIFSPLEPISNVGLYGTYTIYKGLRRSTGQTMIYNILHIKLKNNTNTAKTEGAPEELAVPMSPISAMRTPAVTEK